MLNNCTFFRTFKTELSKSCQMMKTMNMFVRKKDFLKILFSTEYQQKTFLWCIIKHWIIKRIEHVTISFTVSILPGWKENCLTWDINFGYLHSLQFKTFQTKYLYFVSSNFLFSPLSNFSHFLRVVHGEGVHFEKKPGTGGNVFQEKFNTSVFLMFLSEAFLLFLWRFFLFEARNQMFFEKLVSCKHFQSVSPFKVRKQNGFWEACFHGSIFKSVSPFEAQPKKCFDKFFWRACFTKKQKTLFSKVVKNLKSNVFHEFALHEGNKWNHFESCQNNKNNKECLRILATYMFLKYLFVETDNS